MNLLISMCRFVLPLDFGEETGDLPPLTLALSRKESKNRHQDAVAQIFNLLFRRFAIGRASSVRLASTNDPQNPILRNSRLKICATAVAISQQQRRFDANA